MIGRESSIPLWSPRVTESESGTPTIALGGRYSLSARVAIIGVCLLGLLFFSYSPFVVHLGETRVFRPDWLLALPVLGYVTVLQRSVVLTRAGLLALSFLGVAAASAVVSGLFVPFDFLTIFAQLAYAIGLFVAILSMRLTFRETRVLFRFWVCLLAAAGAYGIYQAVALNLGLPFADPYVGQVAPTFDMMGYVRPFSVFGEPSYYSSALVTGIAALVPCVATGRPLLFSRRIQEIALSVLVVAVVLSGSMSGYVTVGLSAIFFLLVPDTRPFVLLVGIVALPFALGGAIIGTLAGVPLVSLVLERLSRGLAVLVGPIPPSGGSIYMRYARWQAGLEAWRHSPLLGTGLGQYATWAGEQSFAGIRAWLISQKPLQSIHGVWVEVLAKTGLLGFLAFAGTWVSVIRSELTSMADTTGYVRLMCIVALSVTVVQLIDWSFGLAMVHPLRWILVGVAASYAVGQLTNGRVSSGRPDCRRVSSSVGRSTSD